MGDILGSVIGGVGSLIGGKVQSDASDKAAKLAAKGFRYLKESPVGTDYLPQGGQANTAISNLLGLGGDPKAGADAFNNYLNSAGYQFQFNEGQRAVNSDFAHRGLLNSGATLKALQERGQGLGGQYFQQYLNNLGGLSSSGLRAGEAIGNAASGAGTNQANAALGKGNAWSDALNGFGSGLGGVYSGLTKPSTFVPPDVGITPKVFGSR